MRYTCMARRKDGGEAVLPGKDRGKPAAAKPSRAFDVWLDRGLHSLFDSVAQEPIPEDMLRLLREDREP